MKGTFILLQIMLALFSFHEVHLSNAHVFNSYFYLFISKLFLLLIVIIIIDIIINIAIYFHNFL